MLAALTIGAIASVWLVRTELDEQYQQRALAVAKSVAALPAVAQALAGSEPSMTLQPLAERIRIASGATFIVVTDGAGIRMSHPNPELIGKPVDEDPRPVFDGHDIIVIEQGTLGVSARGKTPIRRSDGTIIGIVSVGYLEDQISAALLDDLPQIGSALLLAVALGVAGSLLLARRLKQQTFGLEPREIATLLEQREASLHGIREGMVATDKEGRITLVNDEAKRLLGLRDDVVGQPLVEVVPAGRLREVLSSADGAADHVVLAGDRVLVASRKPVVVRGETIGAVATLRDRTELESLVRQLDDARGLTDALRAQAHEFSNRLHTIAGLIELGRPDEALLLSTQTSAISQELTESLLKKVGDPLLGALLLSKAAVAAERGIDLRIGANTRLAGPIEGSRDLITIVGNLVENAFEAVSTTMRDRWVEVSIRADESGIVASVHDSGPGILAGLERDIFTEGFTTKEGRGSQRRGLGLALVKQAVDRRGGTIMVRNDGGALFEVRLPAAVTATLPR